MGAAQHDLDTAECHAPQTANIKSAVEVISNSLALAPPRLLAPPLNSASLTHRRVPSMHRRLPTLRQQWR